ncbi:MAG: UDP-3-O-(3-hydroxymyristoyl)glucosamine N-acyltransferase, partial [Candidatus Omnitrophica bacterium]|nr:UDP-3-O-(3-hydroxymyristoyl)glucosamine N-acyltransferase [Candidatus Omnitrophota bacterium]
IGKDVDIESGVVLGSDGFGFAQRADGTQFKIPQVGIVEVGNHCRIGARSTVDRATLGKTVVGDRAEIGSLVMVGHNVKIGPSCKLDHQCGVSGSTKIGEETQVGAQAGLVGHLKVGAKTKIEAGSGVTKTLPEGTHLKGLFPAMDPAGFQEQQELIQRLPEVVERLDRIEEKTAAAV